ncbi:MAG: DUF4870 domain-containing protein [Chloroflexi bacterium]|nr:DUF4870 domain-containing protein [Chloroflexota bacterium]
MTVPPSADVPPATPPYTPPYTAPSAGADLAYTPAVAETTSDDRMLAMAAHLLGFFTGFIGPLIVYLVKRDQSRFVAYHSLQAVFFQVAINIGYAIAGALCAILIGIPLLIALPIVSLVFAVMAGLAANSGKWYEIPVVGKLAMENTGGAAVLPGS